ncbi:hypothetical protein A3849_27915 [Paenibacillus sp. P46E]|nr:hypothetical protein A3849_27915 [Paenibacillus sp. P46E]
MYAVIDMFFRDDKPEETIAGATIQEATARMIAASAEEGHLRFIEVFENGEKIGEFGYRGDE